MIPQLSQNLTGQYLVVFQIGLKYKTLCTEQFLKNSPLVAKLRGMRRIRRGHKIPIFLNGKRIFPNSLINCYNLR